MTQEMSDTPLELKSKEQAAKNEPTTNVMIKEEYKYDGIEHHYIPYECIKQEDHRDNLEDSQQDPLAIDNIKIENVKREYSPIDHIKQECSTDVLVEQKNGDTQTVDIEEYKIECSNDDYVSTASTNEDSNHPTTGCNEKKEASSILGYKRRIMPRTENENTNGTKCASKKKLEFNKLKVIEKYDCANCDKRFTSKYVLKQHIDTVHLNVKCECPNCNKNFFSKYVLKQHMNTVHYKVQFECNECQKVFSRTASLKTHVNVVHRGINMHVCKECNKNFSRAGGLKTHVKSVHKQIKDYECNECQKTFSRAGGLKAHVNMVHKGIRNECNECHKTFSEAKKLRKHINVVHRGTEKYQCNVCQRNFSEAKTLKTHMIRMH